jgi:hypothetical protein
MATVGLAGGAAIFLGVGYTALTARTVGETAIRTGSLPEFWAALAAALPANSYTRNGNEQDTALNMVASSLFMFVWASLMALPALGVAWLVDLVLGVQVLAWRLPVAVLRFTWRVCCRTAKVSQREVVLLLSPHYEQQMLRQDVDWKCHPLETPLQVRLYCSFSQSNLIYKLKLCEWRVALLAHRGWRSR